MKTVDVVIPTMRKSHAFTCFERLRHIPWPIRLHVVTEGKTWAEAVNIGLAQTENDVILMDDDVFINENTFKDFYDNYDHGDIFGFNLLFPTGDIQHAGGIIVNGNVDHRGFGEETGKAYGPDYVCHVTTSLVYIKKEVFKKIGVMNENIPGVQFEDVDFNFRALKAGLRILYLPGSAIHMQSASKKFIPGFIGKVGEAYSYIQETYLDDKIFLKQLSEYPKSLDRETVNA